jgi:HlyD family secretion protein
MDQIVDRPKASPARDIESALGIGTMRRKRRWPGVLALASLLVLVAAAAAYFGFGGSEERIAFTTVPVERGEMTVETSATGTLQPLTQVDVSSELSGVVRAVPVEENQHVAKGAVLAELDTTRIAAQVERAKASVQAAAAKVTDAEVTLRESEKAFARADELASRGMVADQALEAATATRDRARSALATAKANVAVAEADLELEQADLAKSTIYSPIDGIILSRDVDPGQTVASSLQAPVLFVIAEDLKRMEVVAAVDEADIGGIAKGQDASFTVDAFPGRKFEAKISDISYASTTTEGVVTYEARLAVDNADLSLRPGMTATVAIVTRNVEDALLVPNDAFRYSPPQMQEERGFSISNLFTGRFGRHRRSRNREAQGSAADGTRTLYVLRKGAPVAVEVEPGATDGRRTEIITALKEGDAVITGSGGRSAGGR